MIGVDVGDEAMKATRKPWRPNRWIAAVLGFFLQPLGMLYVVRVKWAIAYFLASTVITVAEFILRQDGRIAWLQYFSFNWLLMIACSVHAFRLAKHSEPVAVRPWYSRWYGLTAFPASIFIVIFGVRAFLYEPFRMPSGSMMPSIDRGAILLAQKFGYGNYGTFGVSLVRLGPTREIQRGDILIFEFPGDRSIYYNKRVIGLPGDHVEYKGRKLYINGNAVETKQISSDDEYAVFEEKLGDATYRVMTSRAAKPDDMTFQVPELSYFVVGDNRDHSNDSRYWGFLPEQNIVGKVVHIFQ